MLGSRALAGVGFALVLGSTSLVEARSFRVDNLPNGNVFRCRNCHNDDSGATMSPFGSDSRLHILQLPIQSSDVVWTEALCNADSDNDGWTNGEELGDPDCTWTKGDPAPGGSVTNPGSPASAPPSACGNGRLEVGEDCDSGKLRRPTCAAIEAGEGSLGCNDDCSYDVSGCSGTPPESAGAGPGSGASSGGLGDGDDGADGGGCAIGAVTPRGASLFALALLASAALLGGRRRR